MAGQTDAALHLQLLQEAFREDPSDWLAHSSLMTMVGSVTTPTLLTGILDKRTPMPQTEVPRGAEDERCADQAPAVQRGVHGTGSSRRTTAARGYMMSWFNMPRQAGGRVTTTASQP
jgi:hypothetical protein